MPVDDGLPTAAARGKVKRRAPLAPAPARPRGLSIVRPAGGAVSVALDDDRRYLVGRHDAADLVIDAPAVSRVHGALAADGEVWVYQDLGSQNGSALERDGVRTLLGPAEKTRLHAGDVLIIGQSECRLELMAEAPAPPPPATASAAAQALDEQLAVAARTRLPVFLLGVSGSGKTHSARALHDKSGLPGAFVSVNCARLPLDPAALHSELLGHTKGAFTGASSDRLGRLPAAHDGTLFLDEVESLPPAAQGFLLDVLEGSGDTSPLGAAAGSGRPLQFRLVSASKAPLARSGLRADLCERLAEGHLIALPTLEQRRDDIPAFARAFAEEQTRLLGVDVVLEPDALGALQALPWPGQLRQLRGAIATCAQVALARSGGASSVVRRADVERHAHARAVAFADASGHHATPADAGVTAVEAPRPIKHNPRHLEAADVRAALSRHGGNQSAAARELGIARNTLLKKMKDFGVDP